MQNVVRDILTKVLKRIQGKWRRPGQWGDASSVEKINNYLYERKENMNKTDDYFNK